MDFPQLNSLNVIFQWTLLTLACFRIQRIVTADSWLPSEALRTYLAKKAAPANKAKRQTLWTELAELLSCGWCFGWWTCIIVFTLAAQTISIPLPALQAIAASGVVGLLATYDGS